MRLADLLKKKNAKINVRVPAYLQKSAGLKESVTGKITGIRTEGRVARIQVTLKNGKIYEFRPQDLSL
jgi:hypothetical protein